MSNNVGYDNNDLRELACALGVSHGATAAAYVRFATRDAALLELMFAGKHREESGPLHEAADRALSLLLELIEQGQAEDVLEPHFLRGSRTATAAT